MRNRKQFELNENESITYQNVWDANKAVLRGEFIAFNIFIRKEVSHINDLGFHLKNNQKEEKINPRSAEENK